jgi:hypothetical protein
MTGVLDRRLRRLEAVAVAAGFLGLGLAWAIASTAFQELDEAAHYSYSRWAFRYPDIIVDIWGRPLITVWYALPAQLGPTAARVSSLVLGAIAAGGAASVFLRAGGRMTALAVACTLGMPCVFLQTYGILTELCFSAVLGSGFALYRSGRPRAAALVWSLLPLARPEGLLVAPLFAVALLVGPASHPAPPWTLARFSCASLLGAGTTLWWLGGLPVYQSVLWMKEQWPGHWRLESPYGRGHPLMFLLFLVLVVTPVLFPFLVIGAIRFWRERLRLEVVVVGFIVALHSALWAFGLFGSAGYPRYLVTVAPLLGAFSARGIEDLVDRRKHWQGPLGRRGRTVLVTVVALVLIGVVAVWPRSGPVHGDADSRMLRGIWPWCGKQLAKNPDLRFVADHPYFFVPGDLDGRRHRLPFRKDALRDAPLGTIAIWETRFAAQHSAIKDRADLEAFGFEAVPKEVVAGPGPYPWDAPPSRWADPDTVNFQWEVLLKTR